MNKKKVYSNRDLYDDPLDRFHYCNRVLATKILLHGCIDPHARICRTRASARTLLLQVNIRVSLDVLYIIIIIPPP